MSGRACQVDGSKFEASASKHRSVTYERAGELSISQAGHRDLMERAAAADGEGEDDPQALPKEIARREALCDRWMRRDAPRGSGQGRAPRPSGRTTRPRWRRARRAPAGPRASTRSRPTRRARRRAEQSERSGQPADAQEQAARVPPGAITLKPWWMPGALS